jgi:hypothetical protein
VKSHDVEILNSRPQLGHPKSRSTLAKIICDHLLLRRGQLHRDHREARVRLTNLLNRYLTEMSDIPLQYGATIEQVHRRRHHGVLRRRELRSEWQELGAEKPLRLRIFINTGFVTVANFGSSERMDYRSSATP